MLGRVLIQDLNLRNKIMNRRYCYGMDCEEDNCRCHDEEIKQEVEMEMAIADYVSSLKGLKEAIQRLQNSNKVKLDAIEKVNPFLSEIINKCK